MADSRPALPAPPAPLPDNGGDVPTRLQYITAWLKYSDELIDTGRSFTRLPVVLHSAVINDAAKKTLEYMEKMAATDSPQKRQELINCMMESTQLTLSAMKYIESVRMIV